MLRNLRPRRSNESVSSQRSSGSVVPEKENVVMNPTSSVPRARSAEQKLKTEPNDVEMHSKSAGPSSSSPSVHSGKRKRNFAEEPEPTGRNTHVRRATLPVSRPPAFAKADSDDVQTDTIVNASAGGAPLEAKSSETFAASPDDFACTEELAEDACEEKECPDSAVAVPVSISADVAMVAAAAVTGGAAAVRQVLTSPESKRRAADSQIPATMSCLRLVLDSNADDMLQVMYEREVLYQPDPDYMSQQPEIDHLMRAILIDWMMEVGQEFSLCRETLQLAANYVDRYLSFAPNVPRASLQLLGVTSLFVASKLEEMMPGKAYDFAVTTDNAYNADQILEMERSVLQTLNWKLLAQTPYSWTRMYIKLIIHELQRLKADGQYNSSTFQGLGVDALCTALLSTQGFFRCMELLDVILLDVGSLRFHASTKAAAALCITFPQIVPLMPAYANYGLENLQQCIDYISNFCVLPTRPLQFPPSAYFNIEVRPDELFTKQMHHPDALDLYKELQSL